MADLADALDSPLHFEAAPDGRCSDKAVGQLPQRIFDPLCLQDVPLLVNDEQLELLAQA
jgi:hypothetical protein